MFSSATKATGALRISRKSLGLDHKGHSSAALFFDYDRDGQLDLFLTNVGQYTERGDPIAVIGFAPEEQPKEYHYYVGFKDAFAGHLKPERTEPSLLFRNLGDNSFVDVTEEVGIKADGWSGDAMPLDANENGWPDLYVLNMQGARPILRKRPRPALYRQEPSDLPAHAVGGHVGPDPRL